MAFTTYTPKAANTVHAQTIAAILDRSPQDCRPCYKLADGSLLAIESTRVAKAGYVPVVGDYLVVEGNKPTVWKASDFTANYS